MSLSILAASLILDAFFGEPRWLWSRIPHPAVVIGQGIAWADRTFNNGGARKAKGVALVAVLGLASCGVGGVVDWLPGSGVLEVLILAALLAHRSLVDHVHGVANALMGSVSEARRAVAKIVGRDVSELDEPGIARAAIESAAENLSDGVIAPVFWYLVLGLPGFLFYKAINTADSMIGYRTERHMDFGWASARLDDVLNWVPARITAGLIALLSGRLSQWSEIVADARLHRSPNAGWPEAAMARALGVAVSGPRSYEGLLRDFPFVNASGERQIGVAEVREAASWLWRAWVAMLVAVLALAALTCWV